MTEINHIENASKQTANFMLSMIDNAYKELIKLGCNLSDLSQRYSNDGLVCEIFNKDKLITKLAFVSEIKREGERFNYVTNCIIKGY